ncbi:transposase, partial [Paenibacillus sp. Pae15]|uniref:transposase n=1 Tax=Paenibacillus sp. Pae15 TaxID=2926018 RepID=UPI0035C7067F
MYIQYNMDQLCLPMDLEEDIPAGYLVRIVNDAVNRLDDNIFAAAYPGGGRDSCHPKMLAKVIVYAYTQRIYSSRWTFVMRASNQRKAAMRFVCAITGVGVHRLSFEGCLHESQREPGNPG